MGTFTKDTRSFSEGLLVTFKSFMNVTWVIVNNTSELWFLVNTTQQLGIFKVDS